MGQPHMVTAGMVALVILVGILNSPPHGGTIPVALSLMLVSPPVSLVILSLSVFSLISIAVPVGDDRMRRLFRVLLGGLPGVTGFDATTGDEYFIFDSIHFLSALYRC